MSVAALATGDTVIPQAATHTVGASFGDARTYLVDGTALDCMVQTMGASEAKAYSARGSKYLFWVFFSADPALTVNSRLKWTVEKGNTLSPVKYLRILDCYSEGRPGEDFMWVADCELVTTRGES